MAEIIPVTQGEDRSDAAFLRDDLSAAGVHPAALSAALADALQPFASLLGEDRGVAIIRQGKKAKIIGLNVEARK